MILVSMMMMMIAVSMIMIVVDTVAVGIQQVLIVRIEKGIMMI
jgi:hypothetical protein